MYYFAYLEIIFSGRSDLRSEIFLFEKYNMKIVHIDAKGGYDRLSIQGQNVL